MMRNLLRFGRRKLHTIVSKETIKPSSPTPCHLKTFNLSVLDQISPDIYLPMVSFYPNSKYISSHRLMLDLKLSLSLTLTRYYPFSGRLPKTTPAFVDCNDREVEFIEATNDNQLSSFLQNMQHEDLDQLFPNGQVWSNKLHHKIGNDDDTTRSPLSVQVNSFSCGGIAIAVSLSHKIADGSSLCNFFNDWAIVTQSEQKNVQPHFISSKYRNLNFQGYSVDKSLDNCVTRSFMFPNSKLNDLKLSVTAMEGEEPIINPSRVEVLNWLLYNCAVQAATENNGGCFQPTGLIYIINFRNKMLESLPASSIGNLHRISGFSTSKPDEIMLSYFITQLRNLKMRVKSIKNVETEIGLHDLVSREEEQRKVDEYYLFTSLCRYPIYGIDFGFGRPVKVMVAGSLKRNSFLAMDSDEGILVNVTLGKEEMEIFQKNPKLLSFC